LLRRKVNNAGQLYWLALAGSETCHPYIPSVAVQKQWNHASELVGQYGVGNYALPAHYYDIHLSIELLVSRFFKALYSSRLVGDG
jgi:hypothetical protein